MSSKIKGIILSVLVILGFVSMIVINALANILPLNNKTTGQLSENLPNLFTPTPMTFSIWGLIYFLLATFIVYISIKLFSKNMHDDYIETIGWLFVLSCIANSAWIFAWHYEKLLLSLIIMIVLLITLIAIYRSISSNITKKEYWLIKLPFSVYLGWISVATIANTIAFLVSTGWNGLSAEAEVYTIILLIVASILAITMILRNKNIAYALVVVWALIGIIIRHLTTFSSAYPSIIITSYICIAIILALIVFTGVKKLKSN